MREVAQISANCILIALLFIAIPPITAKGPVLSEKELSSPPPKIIRTCCSFGANLKMAGIPLFRKTDIISKNALGYHQYLGDKNEFNGIIYTKRGGFIDLGHLRDCADWTAYLYQLINTKKEENDIVFIDLGNEGGNKTLTIEVPAHASQEDIYQLAANIAYDLSLWHEIATWFGTSYIPMVPERFSSFSPEDMYSNLLGIHLGIKALKSELSYEVAMTELINNMLENLESVNTADETYWAMEQVENIWWSGEKSLPNKKVLLKRYLGTEHHDKLTPWLIPAENELNFPYVLNKPDIKYQEDYKIEIKLNYKFPLKTILPNRKSRIVSQNDFGLFMQYIERDIASLDMKMAYRAMKQRKKNKL